MELKQNGFKIVYQETKSNPLASFKSFIMQTKSHDKAINYAKRFVALNNFKLIEVTSNWN